MVRLGGVVEGWGELAMERFQAGNARWSVRVTESGQGLRTKILPAVSRRETMGSPADSGRPTDSL